MENGKWVLAIDIGNTTVAAGVFNLNGKLIHQTKFPTRSFPSVTAWRKNFEQWLKKNKIVPKQINSTIICSVVPKALNLIHSVLKEFFHVSHSPFSILHPPNLAIVGRDIKVPISNRYKNPKQVGQDRLVNAYSGYCQYGAPLIIVDFGTAVTFDVVSKKGEYLGGLITSGLEMACQALHEKTALLPRIQVKPPRKIIGKTAQESIQSGLFYGWGALTDGVVTRLRKEIGPAKVILTGGQSQTMSSFVKVSHLVRPDLTLRGLYLLRKK